MRKIPCFPLHLQEWRRWGSSVLWRIDAQQFALTLPISSKKLCKWNHLVHTQKDAVLWRSFRWFHCTNFFPTVLKRVRKRLEKVSYAFIARVWQVWGLWNLKRGTKVSFSFFPLNENIFPLRKSKEGMEWLNIEKNGEGLYLELDVSLTRANTFGRSFSCMSAFGSAAGRRGPAAG